jgi:hypothetical protein
VESEGTITPRLTKAHGSACSDQDSVDQHTCWGYTWDALPEDFWRMAKVLSELGPDVGWARGCHAHVKGMDRSKGGKDPFTVVASIYDLPQAMQKDKTGRYVVWSNRGWKNPASSSAYISRGPCQKKIFGSFQISQWWMSLR